MGNRYIKIKHPQINAKVPKNAPGFVLEFIRLLKNRRGTLQGDKKKIFKSEDVYILEPISRVEYCRRRRLHSRLTDLKCNTVIYDDMYWYDGLFFGKMKRYDMDLFEYLRDERINIPDMLRQLIPSLQMMHSYGIYLQDIKPENIFIDVHSTNNIEYCFGDVDYAFLEEDFPLFIDDRKWLRTREFSPELGKPKTQLEARRNDMYAFAVMIGRIETFYNNGEMYNVFTKTKGRIIDRDFDDRWKLNEEYVYAEKCANFIMSGLHYKHVINKFLYTFNTTNNYSV